MHDCGKQRSNIPQNMYNDDSYIANETSRGQLEDTQYKTKFRHLWAHTMWQGKPRQAEEKSPLIIWLLHYQLHKIMHTQQNKTALQLYAKNLNGVTQMNGVQTKNADINTTSANYSSEK